MARKRDDTIKLVLRLPPKLHRRLGREAAARNRSLNSEMIDRLDQPFQKAHEVDLTADTLRAAFGGPTGDLLRAIATAIWLIEKDTGKKWNKDPATRAVVETALTMIIEAFVLGLTPRRAAREIDFAGQLDDQTPGSWGRTRLRSRAVTAAFDALRKMGMAPSEAEIAEALRKHTEATAQDPQVTSVVGPPNIAWMPMPKSEDDGEGQ
jgi:hypothetical protein